MRSPVRNPWPLRAAACALLLAAPAAAADAPADSMALRADGPGALPSLTIEAESQVRIEFERPALDIPLDPRDAPGLEGRSLLAGMVERPLPLQRSLFDASRGEASPYRAHPWLGQLREGAVATFQPQLEGVEAWSLQIVDSGGRELRSFAGKGSPPERLPWDGRDAAGEPVRPGWTCSHVVKAVDRAGNERNFVGEGFQLPPYAAGPADMLFAGRSLHARAAGTPLLLVEVADRINAQGPNSGAVRVEVVAPDAASAEALAREVGQRLGELVVGGSSRILAGGRVQPDAPAGGSVRVRLESGAG